NHSVTSTDTAITTMTPTVMGTAIPTMMGTQATAYLLEPASERLAWSDPPGGGATEKKRRAPCPATLRRSPPDRFIARRWASFVGPLWAKSWRADDLAGPAGRGRDRAPSPETPFWLLPHS